MRRVTPDRPWPLHDTAGSRALEARAAAGLPPHTLMQRAGLAVARLTLALAPHARTVWVACGPGNNGGDGLEAAVHLVGWGKRVVVTREGDESRMPPDAALSLRRARDAGAKFTTAPPRDWDFAIDALLGLGAGRPLEGAMAAWAATLNAIPGAVLAVDVPSGMSSDTGTGAGVRAGNTLSLLSLKPGLFTAGGRDAAGVAWFDTLGVDGSEEPPCAWLCGPPAHASRPHDSHKGRFGDVAVIGGAQGMTGAALLAASAALHSGAGRVFASLLGGGMSVDMFQPDLMLRDWRSLDLATMGVACGCGGGDAIRDALPRVLSTAGALVLDADALNAIAADESLQALLRARSARGKRTVLTPHPLEAARLLGASAAKVQAGRFDTAKALCQKFGCVVVLKGSGTITAAPGRAPLVNPTGNAKLATGGTGDVLAGMIAARLAVEDDAQAAAAHAVFTHGLAADRWPEGRALTASALARSF